MVYRTWKLHLFSKCKNLLQGSWCERTWDHITPVLGELHWFNIKARILFKVLLLTYNTIHNHAATYLCTHMEPDVKERGLGSNHQYCLNLQNYRVVSYSGCGFRVAAPRQWNKLHAEIKQSLSTDSFKLRLKTSLFHKVYTQTCNLFFSRGKMTVLFDIHFEMWYWLQFLIHIYYTEIFVRFLFCSYLLYLYYLLHYVAAVIIIIAIIIIIIPTGGDSSNT